MPQWVTGLGEQASPALSPGCSALRFRCVSPAAAAAVAAAADRPSRADRVEAAGSEIRVACGRRYLLLVAAWAVRAGYCEDPAAVALSRELAT